MNRWVLQMIVGALAFVLGAVAVLRPSAFSAGQMVVIVWAGGALFGQAYTKWQAEARANEPPRSNPE